MVNGVILRVFGGLFVSLLFVVGACYFYWSYAQKSEEKNYRDRLITSSLRLVNANLSHYVDHDQKKQALLQYRQDYGMDLRWVTPLALSSAAMPMLQEPNGVYVHSLMDALYWEGIIKLSSSDQNYILLRISQVEERELKALGALAATYLRNQSSQSSPEEAVKLLGQLLGFPVLLQQLEEAKLGQQSASMLVNKQIAVLFDDAWNHQLTLRLVISTQQGKCLVLYPFLEGEAHFPWARILYAALFAFILMVSVSYWALVNFFRRIFKIEEAAMRIRRHDLSARVPVNGGDILSKLALAFNEMAEHIQRLIGSQKEMTHAISHELRTPIARIRFGLEMLESANTDEKRMQQINGMDNDIQELEKLIDELLTYAVLEQGTPSLHLEMVDIDNIAARIKREMDQTGRSIQIEHVPFHGIEESRLAECEQRYIHRALQNLVGNAMKYAKTKVRIACIAQGGMIRVDVEDDGPGIPQDKWDTVFAPFARLDSSRTRSSGGYGLGLSIVQRIVFWHGGIVQAHRSNVLGGARFTMIWPRHQQTRVPVSKLEQLDKVTIH